MKNTITFVLDGKKVDLSFDEPTGLSPTTSVLNYLRSLPNHRGVKEGCAEGDCGACTVVVGELGSKGNIHYRAVDSCLVFLPMIHGKELVTVENLKDQAGNLHPVQQAMVDLHGSQCGFCTPGIVMSLFALSRNTGQPTPEETRTALAGNLCRCTGYRPIIDAAVRAGSEHGKTQPKVPETTILKLLRSISRQSVSLATETQRYDQPVTIKECLGLIRKSPGAVFINGATDVALRVTKGFETIPHIIDLSRVERLSRVSRTRKKLTVGAGLRINDFLKLVAAEFPALHEMLSVFGADQIRNIATLGGNISTASPIGDILPVLMAYDARIILEGPKGKRSIDADKYVTGYRKTERHHDELVVAVTLPIPSGSSKVRSYKVSKRRDLDISTVSAGFRIDIYDKGIVNDVCLAYGGMAERTKRAELTEKFLRGKMWTRETVERAQGFMNKDFRPISDVRGSAEFRMIVAKNLLMKFWNETK